jgi:hypothetical protein
MKYTYWLTTNNIGDKFYNQILELNRYKTEHNAEICFYFRDFTFDGDVISLKCNQNYNDLDLDVNSMSSLSFIRLKQKPKNITESKLQLNYYLKQKEVVNE